MPRRGLTALLALTLTLGLVTPAATAGRSSAPAGHVRIIGGQESAPGQWPWQAAILDAHVTNTYAAFFCGGTVIGATWIMTAAHCVANPGTLAALRPTDIEVLTGTNVLGDGSGRRNRVASIHVNPGWNGIDNRNDVALVRLAKPTTATAIRPVTTAEQALWAPGTVATVSGWGTITTDPAPANYPTRLRHATIPIQSDATCGTSYPPSGGASLTFSAPTMLCAGPLIGGRDTCNGDSGGPLMVPGPGGAGWVEAGITSWGNGCAEAGYPGVYSRLGAPSMAGFVSLTKRFGPFDDATTFITRQFVDFEQRFPSAAELAAWRTRLSAAPASDLISELEASPTWQSHGWAVTRLFRATFLRDPDTSGLTYWIGRTVAGASLASVASAFTRSSEFADRYGQLSDAGFVDRVYRNVFSRPADPGGRSYWTRRLAAGVARGAMVADFAESHEYRTASFTRVRAITAWFALLRRVPTSAQADYLRTKPTAELIDSLLISISYATRF